MRAVAAGTPTHGFPRTMRLLKRAEYELVYSAGQRRSSSQFTIFFRARIAATTGAAGETVAADHGAPAAKAEAASRFGISVKKALGGAVVRNRIRRRIREILRLHRTEIPSGWDIVIHPRPSVASAPFPSLETELVLLLRGIKPKA